MGIFDYILDIEKVILDGFASNESALGDRNDFVKLRPQPISKHLTDDFSNTMHQVDRSII